LDRMEVLLAHIRQGESEALELKKSTALIREGVETVCALANRHGGQIVFGVADDGSVLGQQVSDDTLKNLANAIKLNTDPKLYPSIEAIALDGHPCVLVTVEESPLKPHLAYGRAFLRSGPTNQRIGRDHYEQLLQQRYNGYGFDHIIQPNAVIDDIDGEAVYHFVETANAIRSVNENLFLPVEVILEKLDLLTREGITRAALLLFGKSPGRYFLNQYEIKCGHFFSEEGYDDLTNDQEYSQNLIENFHAALAFVLDGIRQRTSRKDVLRQSQWEFPVPVLREALVNMIVHRDYRVGVKSTLEIRPSRISFANPGHLFSPTITLESLQTHHPSRPGNKLIAKIFHMMGLFESWGGGTLTIIQETMKAGGSRPQFSFESGILRLDLPRSC